jgi:hypothetical protein
MNDFFLKTLAIINRNINFVFQSTFNNMVKPSENPAATLAEIRSIMHRSTRFIALSGLSGVATGLIALVGAGILFAKLYYTYGTYNLANAFEQAGSNGAELFRFLLVLSFSVIFAAFIVGVYFTTRGARRQGLPIWDSSAKRLLINLAIPLSAGGIFCLLLFWHGAIGLILPAMLIFYGMALLHASKYSIDELRNLGLGEVVLGLLAGCWSGQALLFWAIGFGILTIFYGLMMYNRYERKTNPVDGGRK